MDEINGGFVGEIKSDLTVVQDADKGLVLSARILWSFVSAYRVYGQNEYLIMAERAYDELYNIFRCEDLQGAGA